MTPGRHSPTDQSKRLDPCPGGQRVAGLNPAVPTGSKVFSNIFMPLPEPAKEPSHREIALLDARADHVPRPPTRAFPSTAEPAKPAVKESKSAEPPQACTATRQLRTSGHRPRHTGSPQAGRSPGRSSWWDAGSPGRSRQASPATSDAMAAGMRSAVGRTATTVASNTANALL